jgi:hypothetical protein
MHEVVRGLLFAGLLFVAVFAATFIFYRVTDDRTPIGVSAAIAHAREGRVNRIEVAGRDLSIWFKDDDRVFGSRFESDADFTEWLERNNVQVGGTGNFAVQVVYVDTNPFDDLLPWAVRGGFAALVTLIIWYGARTIAPALRRGRQTAIY